MSLISSAQSPPVALTIAGSDCSSGAGIQADLKTFGAFGCYGLTVITCIVAEVPGKVLSIQPVDLSVIRDQLTILLESFPVAAIKTGMLFSTAIIEMVADILKKLKSPPPLVIDPVMVASSGDLLLEPDALSAYQERLFPHAALITPNLDELMVMTKSSNQLRSLEAMKEAGKKLLAEIHVPLLLKGGHLQNKTATDILLIPDGTEQSLNSPFLDHRETHGTGCTYSAAITAGLARGDSLSEAVSEAKHFITHSIEHGFRWEKIAALNQLQ
jgi:hydroxymethylpyrimidine/phosphomethylpyrimidine kinase